jgi:hypothetical protein
MMNMQTLKCPWGSDCAELDAEVHDSALALVNCGNSGVAKALMNQWRVCQAMLAEIIATNGHPDLDGNPFLSFHQIIEDTCGILWIRKRETHSKTLWGYWKRFVDNRVSSWVEDIKN